MKMISRALALITLAFSANGKNLLTIIPGKRLSEVSIGDSASKLKKKGFITDDSRQSPSTTTYMKKKDLLVRLQNDKAVQIWFEGKNLGELSLNGKALPASDNINSFKNFFKGCEEYQGSGGQLLYCEKRGIEITSSGMNGSGVKISVIAPTEVEKIVK
ncbi:hypothetical protein AZI87_08480 [Bdellovibrio bacteriovorus]|uniref:Uncharacterized protein n=1 Tax=Bdellovibrio bacteriovorus TaxID=959 RepID=A0A162GYH3_BDEBC|nr:hypothetical protein [Bdellovibrio bacteriovorus]KYG69232.1 hypothetical protein AZI87_08480 [Bdellovibrio bacteriovorus]